MVEKYPHTFTLLKYTEATKDEYGNTIVGELSESLEVFGRAKINDSSQTTVTENGDVEPFHISISIPLIDADFSNCFLIWKEKRYAIIRFHVYQNRCKIWV